jgi:hypothetical protein
MFGYRARMGYITSQLYAAFKNIGMREKVSGYGRLMRML